jgi:hypothetical protein
VDKQKLRFVRFNGRRNQKQKIAVSTASESFLVLNTLDAPEDTKDETRGVPSFRLVLSNKFPFVIYIGSVKRPKATEGENIFLLSSKLVLFSKYQQRPLADDYMAKTIV